MQTETLFFGGELYSFTKYLYDVNANCIEKTEFDKSGDLKSRSVSEYWNEKLIRNILYDSDGEIIGSYIKEYDTDGILAYTEGNVGRSSDRTWFDKTGKKVRYQSYDSFGKLKTLEEYKSTCDKHGNTIESYCRGFDSDGEFERKSQYKYDSHGNVIEAMYFRDSMRVPYEIEKSVISYY